MFGYVKNEIKLFFSKKNSCLFLIVAVAMILIYHKQYIVGYEDYTQEEKTILENHMEDTTIYVKKYQNKIAYLEANEPKHKKLPDLKIMGEIWKKYQASNNILDKCWDDWKKNEDQIREVNRQLDKQLINAPQEFDLGEDDLYRDTKREWNQRILLYEKYDKDGTKEDVNRKTPTGCYVLNQALEGTTPVFLLLALLILFLNYDIWAEDFDEGTYKIIYLLPCSRRKLFYCRMLVRGGLSIAACVLEVAILFLVGTIRYGMGKKEYVIINSTVLKHISFSIKDNILQHTDKAISIGTSIAIEALIAILFFSFFYSLVMMISYLTKNRLVSICMQSVITILVITYTLLPKDEVKMGVLSKILSVSPIFGFQIKTILDGSLGLGLPLVLGVETLSTIGMIIITRVCMQHQEVA